MLVLKMKTSLQQFYIDKEKPLIMAHRGNRARFPENTLASFAQAIKDGADILETDLHLSADDELICIHDGTVDRTTNMTGLVQDKTVSDLKSMNIIDAQSFETDLKIPLLSETISLIPDNVALALELKSDRFLEAEVCKKLAVELEHGHILDRTICLSFSYQRLQSVRATIPSLPLGWISMSRLLPDKDVEMIGAFWPVMLINPWYVRMAHHRNMFVCPLDPAPEPRLRKYIKMGCDAVLTDDPAKTKEELNKIRQAAH